MPEEGNHFVELSVVHDASNYFVVHDFSDYSAPQYRPRAGGSTVNRPMFTVKPANDDEEFYASIEMIKDMQVANDCTERYQSTTASIFATAIRNRRNPPPQAVPFSSEEGTSPSPSLPHAADES